MNEFTARLEREGVRSISKYLQAILKTQTEMKEQIIELKKIVQAKKTAFVEKEEA